MVWTLETDTPKSMKYAVFVGYLRHLVPQIKCWTGVLCHLRV
jgi:hypothetical protein